MTQADLIAATPTPRTRSSLAADLRSLGLKGGETLLVHSSLSSLGWVCGGAVAVIQALQDVLTEQGTLVMPTHSTDLTDPAGWGNPAVPESWWDTLHAQMPAFDPAITPTRGMGTIAEQFRSLPDVLRSYHPHNSFAAWGRYADLITSGHMLEYSLGENSPLARVYDLDGMVLLLGTEKNTSLHLAEVRASLRPMTTVSGPIFRNGQREWVLFEDVAYDDDAFPPVKAAFQATGAVKTGLVGSATARLMSQRELVDFAVEFWRDKTS